MNTHFFTPLMELCFPRRCPLCAVDTASETLCTFCLAQCQPLPNYGIADALFFYHLSLRALLLKTKYGHSFTHFQVLGRLIDDALAQKIGALDDFAPQAISFVPTYWPKRLWRGLDLPSMFAAKIAKRLNVPLLSTLKRTKLGQTQSNIADRNERRQAVQGLFKLIWHAPIEKILVVDDITTTGATFEEAKKVLKGISRNVQCLAIAKTP